MWVRQVCSPHARAWLPRPALDHGRAGGHGATTVLFANLIGLNAQLDASWSAVPLSVEYLIAGEIRVTARANDSPRVQNETVRVNAVSANFLDAHRSAVLGFLKAYKKSIDWAFSGEPAIAAYAKLFDQHFDVARYIVKEFSSKATAQLDEIKGEGRVLAEALAAKRIPHALTHEDIEGLYDFVAK